MKKAVEDTGEAALPVIEVICRIGDDPVMLSFIGYSGCGNDISLKIISLDFAG